MKSSLTLKSVSNFSKSEKESNAFAPKEQTVWGSPRLGKMALLRMGPAELQLSKEKSQCTEDRG